METIEQLRRTIDGLMVQECYLFANTVGRSNHLSRSDAALDPTYYLRHRIETVRRIWETARTDALALSAMISEDYDAARLWADYVQEEMSHDRLYLRDLARHGINREMVAASPPFVSTRLLIAWLEQEISQLGSLPAVAYSVFVEWNSKRASPLAAQRAAAAFGEDHVKGARAHMAIDERDRHDDMMLEIAEAVIEAHGYSLDVLSRLLRDVGILFRAYFTELDDFAKAADRTPEASAGALGPAFH